MDSKTGEVIWIKETKIMAAANTGQNVVVDDGRVYCGGAQKTVCLSLDNGDLIWEKSNDNACSSPCRMIIDGDKLIVGANWDEIIAYNKYNGKRIWANKKDGIRYRTATPVIYEWKLYTAATSKIFEIDKEDGKIFKISRYRNKSRYRYGAVYCRRHRIFCYGKRRRSCVRFEYF